MGDLFNTQKFELDNSLEEDSYERVFKSLLKKEYLFKFFGIIFCWINSYFSYKLCGHLNGRCMVFLRIGLSIASTICFFVSILAAERNLFTCACVCVGSVLCVDGDCL